MRPSSGVKNIDTAATGTGTDLSLFVSVSLMPYFRELPVPVAAVSVFYIPDDGRMTPETCRESVQ